MSEKVTVKMRFSIVPSRAVLDKDLPPSVFRTLAALGLFGDKDGWCYPSLRLLSEILGISKSAVSKHIKLLKERGYLNVIPRYNDNGGRETNLIQIRFDYPPDNTGVSLKGQQGVSLKGQQGVSLKGQQGVSLKGETLTPQLTDDDDRTSGMAKVFQAWEAVHGTINGAYAERLIGYVEDWDEFYNKAPEVAKVRGVDAVLEAIHVTVESADRPNLKYVRAVLDSWKKFGFKNRPPHLRKERGNGSTPPRKLRTADEVIEELGL